MSNNLQNGYKSVNIFRIPDMKGKPDEMDGVNGKMKRWLSILLAFALAGGVLCAAGTVQQSSAYAGEATETPVPETEETDVIELPEPAEEDPEEGLTDPEEADDGDDSDPVPVDMMDGDEMEEEILEARTLQYGDEGDDVLELQIRLAEFRYYTGNLSGRFREGTREALKSFQKDFRLEVTGIADVETQAVLYAALYRPLRYGSAGDDVKDIQKRLTELGYYKGKISGNFLEATRSAVSRFQENNALPADGIADPDTQSILFSSRAVSKSQAEATPTPVPDLNTYLVDDNEETDGVSIPAQTVTFTKKLKNGSSGKTVKLLQERLTELGYYDGPVSGNYMAKTTRAVKKLQEQNAVKTSGTVDEETWNLIFNDRRVVLPDQTPKPTPEPTPVPFAITVDVANQVTTVYARNENGEYTVPVRRMLCSTGLKATPSDVGDWVLNGRNARWCYFPKWGSYARYWTRINSSIAFHSVIYRSVSNMDMNTSSYKKLGSRASHGCIRLTVEDAKWIYDNVGAGTVVSIVEGMEADPELRDALKLPPLNQKTLKPSSTPEPTPVPEYRSEEKPVLEKRTVSEKDQSPTVYWIQRRLAELGYYQGYCSGKFLAGTKKAVKAFQKAQSLYPSGQVDQTTLDALYAAQGN